MEFEFDRQMEAQNSVAIDNVGDFGLEAIDEDGFYYYLGAKTMLGTTIIASCGPIIPDMDILPSGYTASLNKMQYKEDKINKFISNWLNDKYKKIKEASEISFEEAVDEFKELGDYLRNLSEDTF